MKKHLLAACLLMYMASWAQEYEYDYEFFRNSAMQGDYFFSHVKSTGGSTVLNSNGKLLVSETEFHTPGNALKIEYRNAPGGSWQAAIYHVDKRGMDHFKKTINLSFWIKCSNTDKLPGIQLMRKDSSLTKLIPVNAQKQSDWQQITIPLTNFINLNTKKTSSIIAVVFSIKNSIDTDLNTIYVDDIELLSEVDKSVTSQIPDIKSAKGYEMHVNIAWEKIQDPKIHLIKIYRSENGKYYKAIGTQQPFMNMFTDYTGSTNKKYFYKITFLNNAYLESKFSAPAEAETKPMTDDELLTMVQEASFRYYWEGAEANSGMSREDIPGRQNMIATGASGFGIMALIVGTERGFISRQQSVERFTKILNFLEKAESFHGVYPHFMDGPTGKVEPFFGHEDNGADLVETSFLFEGLLAARQYFNSDAEQEKLIRQKITSLWQKAEWDWFKQTPDSKFLYWHWSPDQGWVINHTLIGWNETMVTYLLAIASPTHLVPASMYYSGWANQDSTGIIYRGWGNSKDGTKYTNGNTYFGVKLDVGVSNGGPLFFTHYSYMGYDPHFITDKYTNYFINNQNIAKINYRYCVENPKHFKGYGENAWGLTASDGPFDYSADEPVLWQDHGKNTPTGAISSFPYLPGEAMKALKNYYFNYGKFLWGEYGFKDAFDLTNNWCSEIYMGLNQAPQVVMIENYRTGLIWKLFMQNTDIQNGLKKLELETKNLKSNNK
jgi:exo beta-1,2-glucooligosaccharide sophorohydrolase (non-reducing end)